MTTPKGPGASGLRGGDYQRYLRIRNAKERDYEHGQDDEDDKALPGMRPHRCSLDLRKLTDQELIEGL